MSTFVLVLDHTTVRVQASGHLPRCAVGRRFERYFSSRILLDVGGGRVARCVGGFPLFAVS